MSRFKKYAHSVASGYVQMGANAVFSLASVPLAFHYLTKAEFGLWALVSQIATYLSLIDMGMSSSVGRALFDFKDERTDGKYGSVVLTGQLVLVLQGVLVVLMGAAATPALIPLLRIPPELQQEFASLMFWQCLVTGAGFTSKIFQHLLVAQHRYEINNYAQSIIFFVNLAALWMFFELDWKLSSLPASNALALLFNSAVVLVACRKLDVFPKRGQWGKLSWELFKEMLTFGRDVFLVTIGAQMILASQTIIVTRAMGLEAAAVWSVCTKTYSLVSQLVWKVYDFSGAAFVEMIVRGERLRLRERFKDIITITASASALVGTCFASCNGPFVDVWTSNRVNWNELNNVLLALWLIAISVLRCQGGLILLTKKVEFLRYIYFLEGVLFFGIATLAATVAGFWGILATSVVCTICLTGYYGLRRTTDYLGVTFREFFTVWLAPMAAVLLGLVPFAAIVWYSTLELPPVWRLTANAGLVGSVGTVLFLRFGLSETFRLEVTRRVPGRFQGLISRLVGTRPQTSAAGVE